MEYSIAMISCPDKDTAKAIARGLVEGRLAACVQILPIESIYTWNNEMCEESELLLLAKTKTDLLDDIALFVKSNHPYDVPEVVRLPITGGSPDYLEWLGATTQGYA